MAEETFVYCLCYTLSTF